MEKKNTSTYRLKDKYQTEVVPAMMKEFNYSNINECPKLETAEKTTKKTSSTKNKAETATINRKQGM